MTETPRPSEASLAGGAAPLSEPVRWEDTDDFSRAIDQALSEEDARRMADLRRRRADVYNPTRERNPYYGDDDIDMLLGRIAELERERDDWKAEALRYAQRGDALQAQLAERDPEKLVAEIERRAERTDLPIWDGSGETLATICIRRDKLIEALRRGR